MCPHCGIIAQQRWFVGRKLKDEVSKIYYDIYLDYKKKHKLI